MVHETANISCCNLGGCDSTSSISSCNSSGDKVNMKPFLLESLFNGKWMEAVLYLETQ